MSTGRQIIESLRKKLQERNADTTYTNEDLYRAAEEQGKWLIKREISAGRIYRNPVFFKTLGCQKLIETPAIDKCCPVPTNSCKVYRTEDKLPKTWIDSAGPVIKRVTSVDGSTDFIIISAKAWEAKKSNPYHKMAKTKYAIYNEGHLYFPEFNPHFINIEAFWKSDIRLVKSNCNNCYAEGECVRFLDTEFPVPEWLEAEMMSRALQQLVVGKQMGEDMQIDKNPNRDN